MNPELIVRSCCVERPYCFVDPISGEIVMSGLRGVQFCPACGASLRIVANTEKP